MVSMRSRANVSGATHLGAVGVKRGLLVVDLDGLGIKIDGGGPVSLLEGIISLVLEFYGLRRYR